MFALALGASALPSALADPPGKTPSLSEIHGVRNGIEAKHQQRLREIENGVQINAYSSDEAIMLRMRENQEYQTHLEVLRREEASAYNALDVLQRRKSGAGTDGGRGLSNNPALPRFQSQSVITYPQGPDETPAEEKPQKEGSSRNVGFGTREVEF